MRIGDVLAGQAHRYSAEANAFGERVLAAAGYVRGDPGSFANEQAHFAKLWETCCSTLTESALGKVRAKVMRVATDISARRHQYRNPEAYLMRSMQNEIRDARRANKTKTG